MGLTKALLKDEREINQKSKLKESLICIENLIRKAGGVCDNNPVLVEALIGEVAVGLHGGYFGGHGSRQRPVAVVELGVHVHSVLLHGGQGVLLHGFALNRHIVLIHRDFLIEVLRRCAQCQGAGCNYCISFHCSVIMLCFRG